MDLKAIEELRDWMCNGAPPLADGRSIIDAVCKRLNAAGVPVDRFTLFLFTIHPLIKGRRLQWNPGVPVHVREAGFELFSTDIYLKNPLPKVIETRRPIRRRLIDPDCPNDFIIVGELIAEGFTDYLCQPVIYIDGEVNTMSWATRHKDGFSEEAIAGLEHIRPALSRLVESYILRVNAANIISTYVGRNAGERVLKGNIKRGDAEEIEAVILFADLKGYTEYSNRHPVADVLERLNRFYDAFEAAIASNGGEILKFMGDGLLAIFSVGRAGDRAGAASRKAVNSAFASVRDARKKLTEEGSGIGFRSALHLGRLHYGNIGASKRLDFTAIGPSVNLAARLLSAAAALGRDDVCSAEIAQLADLALDAVSSVSLKGFEGETKVFAPA